MAFRHAVGDEEFSPARPPPAPAAPRLELPPLGLLELPAAPEAGLEVRAEPLLTPPAELRPAVALEAPFCVVLALREEVPPTYQGPGLLPVDGPM